MRPLPVSPTNEVRIGSKLRAARTANGFTLDQLAGATGLTKGFLSRIERDETSPRKCAVTSRRRMAQPDHLRKWFQIIRPGNQAKNQLNRFARIFSLQHYWRLLHQRHRSAIKDAVGSLEFAFSKWFEVSEGSVHQDRLNIMRCLGSNWLDRRWPI